MAKKATKKAEEEPLKLFYIFYNQERWDNWLKTLSEASFEDDGKGEELPEGFRILDGFSVDITIEVLKIVKLYQNKRFTRDESLDKLAAVEAIVMSTSPNPELEELVGLLQLPKLALFAGVRKYLSGEFDKDIKTLVKKGKDQIGKDDMESALETASNIAAAVIDGAACCGKYVKDDLENPTLFDEWLIECERINEAMTSLKNFDESTGDDD